MNTVKIFQLAGLLVTSLFLNSLFLKRLLITSLLVSLSACSLDEVLFRQASENKVDSEAKQDQAKTSEFQVSSQFSSDSRQGSSWRLPKLATLAELPELSSEVIGIFTPLRPAADDAENGNKDTAIVVTRAGNVALFHIPSGKLYQLLKLPDNLSKVAFYRDTSLLAAAHQQVLEIFSLSSGQMLYSFDRLKTRMNSIEFHPNGQSLLVGASDGRVYRWKFAEPADSPGDEYKILERYYGHSSVVSTIAPHPFGRIFFSGDWTGTMSAFLLFDRDLFLGQYDTDLFGGRYLSKVTPRANAPRQDAVSISKILVDNAGKELYVALQDGRVELWDVRGFEKRAEGVIHKGMIYDIVLNTEGTKLASAGRDGRVVVWSFVPDPDPRVAPKATIEFEVRFPMVSQLSFIEDGKLIAGNASGQIFEVKKPT